MGAACCVAARDRTITNGPSSEVLQRNVRYSPSWSFRWDNRGRVAGEDTSLNWLSDGISRNDGLDSKSGRTVQTTYASEEGSPLDSSRTLTWQKSPISEGNAGSLVLHSPEQPSSGNFSTEVKASTESLAASDPSPAKLSPSVHSISSLSASPLSSKSHLLPANLVPSRWSYCSPRHQMFRQVSDSRITGHKSPNFSISEETSYLHPGWSNESTRGSNGGSSDSWSIPAFSELMASSHQGSWSFDSESLGFNREKMTRSSSRLSSSQSIDVQICGVCSKLLTELFVDKEEEYIIRLKVLQDRVAEVQDSNEELMTVGREIIDFHGEMVLLLNYSALNYTGLVKILKKYDKRTGALIRMPFIQKVLQQPFFKTDILSKLVKECETMLDPFLSMKEHLVTYQSAKGERELQSLTRSNRKGSIQNVPEELAEIKNIESMHMKHTSTALEVLNKIRSGSSTVSMFSLPPLQTNDVPKPKAAPWKKIPVMEQAAE